MGFGCVVTGSKSWKLEAQIKIMSPTEPESPDYVDERKIITGVISRYINRVLTASEQFARSQIAELRNQKKDLLINYLIQTSTYCRKVRNILYDADSVDIRSIYVSSSLRLNKKQDKLTSNKNTDIMFQSITDQHIITQITRHSISPDTI